MEPRTMRQLVVSAPVGRLGTVDARQRPHLVPICFALLGEVIYTAVDHKPKRSDRLARITNIRATGHACLLVDEYRDDWSQLWWVRVDGHGRVVDDPSEAERAVGALVAKYRQYAEQPPTGPVIAIDPERWSGWSALRSPPSGPERSVE